MEVTTLHAREKPPPRRTRANSLDMFSYLLIPRPGSALTQPDTLPRETRSRRTRTPLSWPYPLVKLRSTPALSIDVLDTPVLRNPSNLLHTIQTLANFSVPKSPIIFLHNLIILKLRKGPKMSFVARAGHICLNRLHVATSQLRSLLMNPEIGTLTVASNLLQAPGNLCPYPLTAHTVVPQPALGTTLSRLPLVSACRRVSKNVRARSAPSLATIIGNR